MQTNLEQVTEMIRTFPLEDLEKLGEVINKEKQAKREKGEVLQKQLEDYTKAKNGLPKMAKNI